MTLWQLSRVGTALYIGAVAIAPADAETLADAIALAYRDNPSIQGSRYDLRAADENISQAAADLRPTGGLSVTADYDRNVAAQNTLIDPSLSRVSAANGNQAIVTVSQPLYTGGRATADRLVAQAGVSAQREVLRSTEGDLLLAVITAYADVRRYQIELEVWNENINELEKLNREIVARTKAGQFTRTDIAQADGQLASTRASAASTELSLESARADYAAVVGRDPGKLEPLPALPLIPKSIAQAYDDAERNSPELAQAQDVELGSRGQISVSESAGRPTVALQGTAELAGTVYPYRFQNQDRDFTASVVVSIPLFAGGRIASQIRQAEDRNTSDRIKIEAARRQMNLTVRNAWNQMVVAQRTATLFDTMSTAAATQLEGSIAEYRVGLRSTFDLLYAQQTLRDANLSALDARRNGYIAMASLLRQAGLLEVHTLLTSVPLYDPAVHYRDVSRRNAVPWQQLIAAIDQAGAPRASQKAIRQPPRSQQAPVIVTTPGAIPIADIPLARSGPTTPESATIGVSAPPF